MSFSTIKLSPRDKPKATPIERSIMTVGMESPRFTLEQVRDFAYDPPHLLQVATRLVDANILAFGYGGFALTPYGRHMASFELYLHGGGVELTIGPITATSHWAVKALAYLPDSFTDDDMADFVSDTEYDPDPFIQALQESGLVSGHGPYHYSLTAHRIREAIRNRSAHYYNGS